MSNTCHIIGATGLLGGAFVQEFSQRGIAFTASAHSEVSIIEPTSLGHLKLSPGDVVLNCAGYTKVDQAESEPDAAYALNDEGPGLLAAYCLRRGAQLIHFSTDYVFPGASLPPQGGFEPDDPLGPTSIYGLSKAAGERRVRTTHPGSVIIRTAWLYSGHPGSQDFVRVMAEKAREQAAVKVVSDQTGSPTWVPNLVAVITSALTSQPVLGLIPGVFHLTGSGHTTWFDFAREIYRILGHSPDLVTPQTTKDLGRPAPRPTWSVLSNAKWEQAFGSAMLPWDTALRLALES